MFARHCYALGRSSVRRKGYVDGVLGNNEHQGVLKLAQNNESQSPTSKEMEHHALRGQNYS